MMAIGIVVGVVLALVVAGGVVAAVVVLMRASQDHQARMAVESRRTLFGVLDRQAGAAPAEPPAAILPPRATVRVLPAARLDRPGELGPPDYIGGDGY